MFLKTIKKLLGRAHRKYKLGSFTEFYTLRESIMYNVINKFTDGINIKFLFKVPTL